jgi:hypothetical protein
VSCHHLALDLTHLSDKSTIVGSPLGGLTSIFSRQLARQVGVWLDPMAGQMVRFLSSSFAPRPDLLHIQIYHLGHQR